MSDATFNPKGYNKTQIADALENGLAVPGQLKTINENITNLIGATNTLSGICEDLEESIGSLNTTTTSHTASITAINNKISNLYTLINQITFEGSKNKLQLDGENMTVTGSSLSATFTNGSIHITKSTSLFSDSATITLTDLTIPAGTWYLGVPITGSGLVAPWVATLKDSFDTDVVATGTSGVSESFTLYTDLTDASIEISILNTYSTSGTDLVPYISSAVIPVNEVTPYFKPLAEVSQVESS